MKKGQKTGCLLDIVNSAPVKALIKTLIVIQAAAPIIQMLAAVKTLMS